MKTILAKQLLICKVVMCSLCLLYILLYTTVSSATLTWTAPGDDDTVGTAAEYDLRYSAEPITEENWMLAESVEGEPIPSVAGSKEVYHCYIAIKTVDEAGNWSGLSNVLVVPIDCEVFDPGQADFDCSGQLDISDLVILIEYMFSGGQ